MIENKLFKRIPYAPLPLDLSQRGKDNDEIYGVRAIRLAERFVKRAVTQWERDAAVGRREKRGLTPRLQKLATGAALALVNEQVLENNWHYQRGELENDPLWGAASHGLATPEELILFTARHADYAGGYELARLTDIGNWDARRALQAPVYEAIGDMAEPRGHLLAAEEQPTPFYEHKFSKEGLITIARKQPVAVHTGEPLPEGRTEYTIESSHFFIDVALGMEDVAARGIIRAAKRVAHNHSYRSDDELPAESSETLRWAFEETLQTGRPEWIIPHLVTAYATTDKPRYLADTEL